MSHEQVSLVAALIMIGDATQSLSHGGIPGQPLSNWHCGKAIDFDRQRSPTKSGPPEQRYSGFKA
jgi:hypothetical protein